MKEELEKLIEAKKASIKRSQAMNTQNEYNEAWNQGFIEGLEFGLIDLEKLLETLKEGK